MDLSSSTTSTSRFQHYELLKRADGSAWELGRGTMGVTYKAFDVNLRCEVALKIVNPSLLNHSNARERFVREARAAARLRHRNIASVYHLGNDGEHFFYAMEFIDGDTLDALVRRKGALQPGAALDVLLQADRALAAAARQGLVHRDIKPGNIMVVHEDADEERLVKLIDFGLARPISQTDGAGHLTLDGFVGTPQFTSPEQLDERPVDTRSDIYSLGVTAWFLLTGRAPFTGSLASICDQHLTQPLPWERMPAHVPQSVRTLLAHMLEKDPGRRPQDPVELRRNIEACMASLPPPAPAPPAIATPSTPRGAQPAETGAPGGPPADPVGKAMPTAVPADPRKGMILKGRFELLRTVGEGSSGRVFQARDRGGRGDLCAVRFFSSDLIANRFDGDTLANEVRHIQGAPHSNLITFYSADRLVSRNLTYLVQEWLQGFTLRDLLAARKGTLGVHESLRILEQAAAAVDHAAERRLEWLDLSLHQLHVHFSTLPAETDEQDASTRALLQEGAPAWPRWTLKINPLGAIHDELESKTWAGDVTLMSVGKPSVGRDKKSSSPADLLRAVYQSGLAHLVYECFGGAAMATTGSKDGHGHRYVSLPLLSEKSNAVLQRAICEEGAFESSWAFYEELARSAGFDPANLHVEPQAVIRRGLRTQTAPPAAVHPDRAPAPALQVAAKAAVITALPVTGALAQPVRAPAQPVRAPTQAGERRTAATWVDSELLGDTTIGSRSFGQRIASFSGLGGVHPSWLPSIAVGLLLLAALFTTLVVAANHRPVRGHADARTNTGKPINTDKSGSSAAHPEGGVTSPVPQSAGSPSKESTAAATAAGQTPPALAPGPSDASSPDERRVRIHIDSRPPGAEVSIQGRVLGTTPLDTTLPPGDHQIVARYRNWQEIHHAVHLDPDQAPAIADIRLVAPPPVATSEAIATNGSHVRKGVPGGTPHRDTPRPVTTATPVGHSPGSAGSPGSASASPAVRNDPFLPREVPAFGPQTQQQQPEVRRALPPLTPFELDDSRTRKVQSPAPDSGDSDD